MPESFEHIVCLLQKPTGLATEWFQVPRIYVMAGNWPFLTGIWGIFGGKTTELARISDTSSFRKLQVLPPTLAKKSGNGA